MKLLGRLVGLAAVLAGLWACDDDGGGTQATVDATVGADGGGDAEVPFNYIPLNDEACTLDPAAPALAASADQVLTRLVTGQSMFTAQGLEVCGVNPSNGCPACAAADNPMGRLLADLDQSLAEYIATVTDDVDLSSGLVTYFQRALRFPYRYLLVTVSECRTLPGGTCPNGSVVRVALTQGKKQTCVPGAANCKHFTVEPESLSAACNTIPMALFGAAPVNAGGKKSYEGRLFADARDDVTFGFLVPLTDELPPNAEALSDAELAAWIEQLESLENSLAVRISDPIVKVAINADGKTGCGTLTGFVPKAIFQTLFADEGSDIMTLFNTVILPRYVDPGQPDFIKAVLSFKLDAGTYASGVPCGAGACGGDTAMCAGNVLNTSYTNNACAQPRPATYTSGARINAQCTPAAATPWSIDCAELGGTCANNRCSTAWTPPEAGQVIFTEIMAEPAGATPEWFELTNVSNRPLDLADCVLRGRGGDVGEKVTIRTPGPYVVGPGDAVVIAQGDTVGNARVYHQPRGDLALSAGAGDEDLLRLYCDDVLIDEVVWTADAFGFVDGSALQLKPGSDAEDNDDPASWCPAPTPAGTPGAANVPCP